ncbi:MAG TPA: hypothetical protein VGN42_21730 [Pirellulales bacterium]|nr:hypothetical protein [Pirellulales bacterium]
MGRLLYGDAADVHAIGQEAKPLGGLARDVFGRLSRPQGVRRDKQLAQYVEVGRLGKMVEVEGMDFFGRAREVGMDLEAVEVADDQQRRVLQGFAIQEELAVGRGQVFVLALVFPAEVAAKPNVGPALAAARLADAALERVKRAVGIGRGRLRLLQHVAQVKKMLLASAPLGKIGLLPLGDEILGRHTRNALLAKVNPRCDAGDCSPAGDAVLASAAGRRVGTARQASATSFSWWSQKQEDLFSSRL